MFDSIYLMASCPHCKDVREREFQTKELGRSMSIFRQGDFVSKKHRWIEGYTHLDCCTKEHVCGECGSVDYEYASMTVNIHIDVDGKITGEFDEVDYDTVK